MPQHGDEQPATVGQRGPRGYDLGHLYQRSHAFLHPRATGRSAQDEWDSPRRRSFHRAGESLAGDFPHASAEVSEIEAGDLDIDAADARAARGHGLAGARGSRSVRVSGECERIARRQPVFDGHERVLIDEARDAFQG
jgi:hypothetical protein